MANSLALDTLRQANSSQKFVRAAVRVRAVNRIRHHPSAPASDLNSADKALRALRTAAAVPPCRNLTASPENCQPSVDIA